MRKARLQEAAAFMAAVLVIWALAAMLVLPYVLGAFVNDAFLALNLVTIPATVFGMRHIEREANRTAEAAEQQKKRKKSVRAAR